MNPVENSDIGEALRQSPDTNSPWSTPQTPPGEVELPAYMRRGPFDPGGQRQLVFDPTEQGMAPPPSAPPMDAPPQGPVFDPNQQELFGPVGPETGPPVATEPRGEPVPPNLRERRAFQQMQLDERAAASQQNPAALPGPESATIEQQILDVDDAIQMVEEQIATRPPRDPRKRFLREELKRLQAQLRDLESAWQDARLAEGPQGVQPDVRVDAPEPLNAPGERMPDGRPVGVAPPPLPNPEPMSPEEAASREQTQRMRGEPAPAAQPQMPGAPAPPAAVAAAAQQSEQQVSPSTPEPAEDIAAQVEAMADPATDRDAVFVAEGNESAMPAALPEGAIVVRRRGIGTLITTNQSKAQKFRRARKDADIAAILGYSENKADVIAAGQEPVVVQARSPEGAVEAEQIATPARRGAAAKAVARQARRGATVTETTVQEAQQRRSTRGEQVKARARDKAPAKKPPRRGKKSDDERRPATQEAPDAPAARSTPPRAPDPAPAAAPTADTVERATTRKRQSIESRGQLERLPERLTTLTGRKGATVDLRVQALDEAALLRLTSMLESGTVPASDRAMVESLVAAFDQMSTMLDASVKAAEDRVKALYESEPDGGTVLREYEQRQLELENRGKAGSKGRKREVAKDSPLYYLPLLRAETRQFLRALRDEAKAEAGNYAPATSLVRVMLGGVDARMAQLMEDQRQGATAVSQLSRLTDADLEQLLEGQHHLIRDSVVAKQVVRGATEVARAKRIADGRAGEVSDVAGDGNTFTGPREADHRIDGVEADVMTHATAHGTLPAGVKEVVNGWVQAFERGGNKFSAPVHVMSLADAMKQFPSRFAGTRVPNGKFIRVTDAKGKTTAYVIAVDWQKFGSEAVATEVLAHEFGHMVAFEMYARADPRTRQAIDRAFDAWRQRNRGRHMGDLLLSEMLPAERRHFERMTLSPPESYVMDFHEWMARNSAMYIMDPNRPMAGLVDRFLKRVADALRAIYAQVTGHPQPDATWAEALDRWVSGSLEVGRMPSIPDSAYSHEAFEGKAEAPALARTNLVARQATAPLTAVRDLFKGNATLEDVRQVTTETIESAKKGSTRDWINRIGLALMTMRQIERRFRDTPIGVHLTAWVRAQQLKAKTANAMMEGASQWMERANMLDAKVRATLERVMHDATHFNVHPDVAFDDEKNAHLRSPSLSRHAREVNEKRYMGVRALYDAAVRADPAVAAVYAGLRDQFVGLRRNTLNKQKELVDDLNVSEKAKEQIRARIEQALKQTREGPYFPLMRFGKWIVKVQLPALSVGKGGVEGGDYFTTLAEAREELRNQRSLNPGSRVAIEKVEGSKEYLVRVYQSGVYFFDNEAQALAANDTIMAEVRENYTAMGVNYDEAAVAVESEDADGSTTTSIIGKPFMARDDYNASKQPPAEFMTEIHALLKDKAIDPEIVATLERLAAETLPENNYRQSLLPRQNVFGASKHMLRAYAHRFQGAAHHYATVEHGRTISRAWEGMNKATRDSGYAEGGAVVNALWKGQELLRARTTSTLGNTVSNVITDASSLYSLGFSPAYVLMNSMQPWLVTAPVLAGYVNPAGRAVGLAKTTKYLREAYEGALPFFTKRGIDDFINESRALAGAKGTREGLQDTASGIISRFGKTDDERAMLQDLLERGTLDFAWLNSLEDAMRGGAVGQKWAALQRLGMAVPQQVEAMNRVVTALAAFRMAKDEKLTDGSFASLTEFADDAVADTQLDYSRMNRPIAFNLPGLSVMLQFKLYMQGMYMLLARSAAQAMAKRPTRRENETDAQLAERVKAWQAERRQGRRTFAYMMVSHAAAAGAAGLGPVSWAAQLGLVAFAAMTPDEEDDWKSGEQLMREMLTDLFGERAGLVAERGLPAVIGADLSDRVGLPVLADTRFAQIRETDSPGDRMDKWVVYGLGAPYSNLKRVVTGVADTWNGDFDQASNALPAGVRAMARSVKWASQGVVDRNGDTFIPRENLHWGELTMQALGIAPASTTRAYSERTEVKQTTARILEERKRLLQADRTGKNVREDIRVFNATVPRPFRIDAEDRDRSRTSKAARERGEASKQENAVRKMLDG